MGTKHKIRRAKKKYLRALKRGDHETRNRAAGVLRQVRSRGGAVFTLTTGET